MAVSKSFEYINSNGVKTTVELGAKAQNVDVDGKPLTDVLDNKLERIVLDEGALGKWTCDFSGSPAVVNSTDLSYDNDAFLIDKGHCACSQSGGFATVTSDNNAVVGGRAYFIFPKFARSQTARKANLKIEFDIRIPVNSRWVVGLVDVDRRGDYAGDSYQDSYSLNGVAAWCGVDNETGLMKLNKYRLDQLNTGIAEDKKNWSDKWIRFEAEVLNGSKWATCYLKDPDTGEELAKTNMAFLDNNAAVNDVSVTGIEFYTWWENHIDIDNISVEIISNWDNALYMYPDGKGEYRYFVTPTGASLYEIGSLKQTANGGFEGGDSASATSGGAVGYGAIAHRGGAVGHGAKVEGEEGDDDNNGFAGGEYANAGSGGAVGYYASATYGAAVGYKAKALTGGAVGEDTKADAGFAGGEGAVAGTGAAIGCEAKATNGFSGGASAKSTVNAIQLGTGTNDKEKTLQVYDYTLMNADGTIPSERLPITGIPFGECTSANTATAKTVNIPGFELKDGATVVVRFKNGHTAAADFTLNINRTGAKNVLTNGLDGFSNYSGAICNKATILLTYATSSNAYICVTPMLADYASWSNMADRADGLSTGNTGSETEPVFFNGGTPVSCDMYNYQKNPIQRIGTWLDGTPIWRYAFDNDLDTDTKNHIKNYHEVQILPESKFSDPNEVFTLNAVCYLRSGYYNCYIDDPPLSCGNDGVATVAEATANRIENYSGYYGYIELVANGSNIKK